MLITYLLLLDDIRLGCFLDMVEEGNGKFFVGNSLLLLFSQRLELARTTISSDLSPIRRLLLRHDKLSRSSIFIYLFLFTAGNEAHLSSVTREDLETRRLGDSSVSSSLST